MGSNIIELAKLGHERAAELKASCGAVDVRSLAQLISDLASQLEVQYVRAEESQREFRAADATINNLELKLTDMAVQLANAESKCRELAAENAAIKAMNDCLSEELRGYESDGAFEGPKMHLLWWKTETPSTDAFLAEVRAQGVGSLSNAALSVIAERQRQQSAEGWTTEHDDDHSCGEMALAASSYAQYAHRKPIAPAIPFNWPWEPEWFKQQGPRRDLVKAGALILAEIERIDRAAAGKGE